MSYDSCEHGFNSTDLAFKFMNSTAAADEHFCNFSFRSFNVFGCTWLFPVIIFMKRGLYIAKSPGRGTVMSC